MREFHKMRYNHANSHGCPKASLLVPRRSVFASGDLRRYVRIDRVLVNVGYAPQRLTAMGRLPSANHKEGVAADALDGPPRRAKAEAERHQRPDQTESRRQGSSGHSQPRTRCRRSAFMRSAVLRPGPTPLESDAAERVGGPLTTACSLPP